MFVKNKNYKIEMSSMKTFKSLFYLTLVAGYLFFTTSTAIAQTGYITKYTGVSSYGTSAIFESSSNIGIGTTSPGVKLDVAGTIRITGSYADMYMTSTGTGAGTWRILGATSSLKLFRIYDNDNAVDRFNIDASGRVGIGTGTTAPLIKLDVRSSSAKATTTAFENIIEAGSSDVSSPLVIRMGIKTDATAANRYGAIEVDDAGTKRNLVLEASGGNVGIGTTSPLAKLHMNSGSLLIDGTTGSTPISGAGTRMMWIPAKAAFRAGIVSSTEWDDANIGNMSIAMGAGAKASGDLSTALGYLATATSSMSTAIGPNTLSSNTGSVALGSGTIASGYGSTAIGYTSTASSNYSIAMGTSATASGEYATAMGYSTTASGNNSLTFGLSTAGTGFYSVAGGMSTTSQAYCSFVTGRFNVNYKLVGCHRPVIRNW